jgi:hypothetical protein
MVVVAPPLGVLLLLALLPLALAFVGEQGDHPHPRRDRSLERARACVIRNGDTGGGAEGDGHDQ